MVTEREDIVLDFFAGSSTTAHSVMLQNAADGGNRKFIMVQLDEMVNKKPDAFSAGFKTIPEVSRERIRRAGKKILEGDCHQRLESRCGLPSAQSRHFKHEGCLLPSRGGESISTVAND